LPKAAFLAHPPLRRAPDRASGHGRLPADYAASGVPVLGRGRLFVWLGSDCVAATVARVTGGQPDAVADQAAKDAVTGRFTQPQEVADLVLMLASGRAGNVTGADFVIDGGMTTTLSPRHHLVDLRAIAHYWWQILGDLDRYRPIREPCRNLSTTAAMELIQILLVRAELETTTRFQPGDINRIG
jgi:hypothetical protein